MNRSDWQRGLMIGVVAGVAGFLIGRAIGPAPIEFSDPGETPDARSMERAVREALAEPRAFPRTVALSQLMQKLSPENVDGARAVFDEKIAIAQSQDAQIFLAAWTHLDPYGAFDATLGWKSDKRREYGVGVIVREWAASGKAVEALTYLRQEADVETARHAVIPLIRGWAQSGDIGGATQLAADLARTEGEYPGLEEGLVRGVLGSKSVEETIRWAEDLAARDDSELGTTVLRTSLLLVAAQAPERAIRWYEALEPRSWAQPILPTLTGHWVDEDPRAAMTWLSTRPAGPERTRALSAAMKIWASNDLLDAQSWLEQGSLTGEALQDVLPPFLKQLALHSPQAATHWVDRLEDPRKRSSLITLIARRWSRTDPDAASAWLAGVDDGSGER